jgi:hypothetical protein
MNDTVFFATDTPKNVKLSVATGATGTVVTIGVTGAGVGTTGSAGVTGPPAALTWAQYRVMANGAGSHVDENQYINFNNTLANAADGSITRLEAGTSSGVANPNIQISKSGNYLISFAIATNGVGPNTVPDIEYVVNDATGQRITQFLNIMPQGGTSGTVTVPITVNDPNSPATFGLRVKTANNISAPAAWISLPGAQPQGELSIVKIS